MTAYFRKFSPAFSSVNGRSLPMNVAQGRCIGAVSRLPVGIVAAVALSGCSTASSTDRRTLIDSRDTYDPRSLDPAMSTDVPTGRAVGYLFDGLTTFDASANVKPGLAERWDVSPDGKRYVFHLRSGVRFHDGTRLTARQVAASWKRVLDPKTKAGGTMGRIPRWETIRLSPAIGRTQVKDVSFPIGGYVPSFRQPWSSDRAPVSSSQRPGGRSGGFRRESVRPIAGERRIVSHRGIR